MCWYVTSPPPSSLQTTLPWLEYSALLTKEEERKERVKRQVQLKQAEEGKGFPPPPLQQPSRVAKPYVSAYNRDAQVKKGPDEYYCEVCKKQLNGLKPYQAHMVSKAHKEEMALRGSSWHEHLPPCPYHN